MTLDTGAETNMIRESTAHQIGVFITTSSQVAIQANGKSLLSIKGKTKIYITHNDKSFFKAFVFTIKKKQEVK